MEKQSKTISPKYYGLISGLLAMLGMYLILSYHKCIGGERLILAGDLFEQYIPYIKMFWRDILSGESIWYSWNTSMGMNTSLINAYYAFSPFNIFYLIFWNVDESVITALIILLKSGFAAYTFQFFLKRVMRCESVHSILFSLMYALSMYAVYYGVLFNSWMDGVIMLPLICTCIYELEKKRGNYLKLVLLYTVLFVSQFYIGYMVGIFSFLFWLVLLFARDKDTFSGYLRRTAKYISSVVLAIGMTAVVLLPALLFLLIHNPEDATQFETLSASVFELVYALFWGSDVSRMCGFPVVSCGWLVLLLLPLYFVNKEIKRREKIRYGILMVFFLLSLVINPLYRLMHAFDAPDHYFYRHAFLIVFLFCALAAKQSMYITRIKMRDLLITLGILVTFYPIAAWFAMEEHEGLIFKIVVNVLIAFLWFGLWMLLKKNRIEQKNVAILAIIILMAELFTNGLVSMDTSAYPKTKIYRVWKEGIEEAVDEISSDEDFYRMYYNIDMVNNSDSWFGYNGVSDFCSSENYHLRRAMQSLGLYTSPRILAPMGAGMTPPMETVLGVKYVVLGVDPNYEINEQNNYEINENAYTLSLGYAVADDIKEYELGGTNSFENVNVLLRTMSSVDEDCFVPYAGDLFIECDQSEFTMNEAMTTIKYDKKLYEYGMVTYTIYKENVNGPMYIQIPREESFLQDETPFWAGGYENIFTRMSTLTVSYMKPLLIDEERYAMAVYMDDTTVNAWSFNTPLFYEYNETALAAIHENLSQSQLQVEEYADGYVKGTVDVPTEKTVLFTSIPYDEGWTAYVDGAEWETIAVVGDAFMALELEPGHHEVEFTYEAPGVKEGILVSSVSAGIYAALIVLYCVTERKKRRKKEESEQ